MASFFTNPSDTNYHSGSSVGPIKSGDTQTSVNEKLAAEIEFLKQTMSAQSNSYTPVDTDKISNKSGFGVSDSFVSTDSKIKISVKPNSATIDVFYDLSSALGTDEKLFNKVTVEGRKNGSNAIIVDSDKISSGFSLAPENFPAFLTVDLRKRTQSGDEYLSGKIAINQNGEESSTSLYTRKFGGSDLDTQTKVNDFLFDRLKKVENSVQNTVNISGQTKTIQEAITDLHIAIEGLKNLDLSNINVTYKSTDSSNGSVSKTISDALSDISDRLSSI